MIRLEEQEALLACAVAAKRKLSPVCIVRGIGQAGTLAKRLRRIATDMCNGHPGRSRANNLSAKTYKHLADSVWGPWEADLDRKAGETADRILDALRSVGISAKEVEFNLDPRGPSVRVTPNVRNEVKTTYYLG